MVLLLVCNIVPVCHSSCEFANTAEGISAPSVGLLRPAELAMARATSKLRERMGTMDVPTPYSFFGTHWSAIAYAANVGKLCKLIWRDAV